MARVIGLGHVGIYVRDLERMAAFYRDVLGMTVTKQNRDIAIAASMNHGVKDRSAAEADYDGAVDDLSRAMIENPQDRGAASRECRPDRAQERRSADTGDQCV